MKLIRILLIVANAAALLVLLAIPVGRLFGTIEEQVGAAAVIGWLMFFVPLFASALALWGICFSRPALTRPFVLVAMPGSFLMACVSVFTYWKGPSNFAEIAIGAIVLLGLNVLVLWQPFLTNVDSPTKRKQ